MKTYKSAKEVKQALLNCETVKVKGWAARINEKDEIEISAPNGVKVANSLLYLDRAVADFLKEAGSGMPDKTPAPVSFENTPSGSGPLGDDSTSDSPWSDPKVNTQPVMSGGGSDEGLGKDTTGDKPWTDPSVDEDPEEEAPENGLSDPDLGSDTSQNATEWDSKLHGPSKEAGEYKIDFGGDTGTYGSWDEAYSIFKKNYMSAAAEKAKASDESTFRVLNIMAEAAIKEVGEDSVAEPEKEASFSPIVDTYETPQMGPTYQELIKQSPSADLLRDIADPDKWAANQVYTSIFGDEEGRPAPGVKRSETGGGIGMGDGVALPAGGSVTHPKKKKKEKSASETYVNSIRSAFRGEDLPEIEPEFERQTFVTASTMKSISAAIDKFCAETGMSRKEADVSFVQYINDVVKSDDVNAAMDAISRGVPVEAIYELAYNNNSENILQALDNMLSTVATRIRENWGQDGTYSRDIDAESAEELYHITRSLGMEDDYDWSSYGTSAPEPPTNTPMGSPMEAPVDDGMGMVASTPPGKEDLIKELKKDSNVNNPWAIAWAQHNKETGKDKKAVDDSAKEYWKSYFKDYGEALVKDDSSKKKDSPKPKTPEELHADRSKDDKYEPEVHEQPKPSGQQKVKAQMAGGADDQGGAPLPTAPLGAETSPGGPGAVPIAPAPTPATPAPKAPVKAPGAGDEGLKGLGWTDQDIQAMSDEDKQKILDIKLKKPGTGVKETTQPSEPAPIKPPVDPTGPGSAPNPVAPEAGPDAGPAPLPMKPQASADKAFSRLTAQVAPESAPAAAPAAPAAAPAAPAAAEPDASEFSTGEGMSEASPESEALKIYNEIMKQPVQATTPEEVPSTKAQMLVQRLLTEVGMPINEARTLFGLTKDKGFSALFN